MTPWIDVAERLPEVGVRVLVYAPKYPDKYFAMTWVQAMRRWELHISPGGGCAIWLNPHEVTAWREIEPVPEPPATPELTADDLMRLARTAKITMVAECGNMAITKNEDPIMINGLRCIVAVKLTRA